VCEESRATCSVSCTHPGGSVGEFPWWVGLRCECQVNTRRLVSRISATCNVLDRSSGRYGLRSASQINTRRLGSGIGSLRVFELFGGLRAPTSDRWIVKRLACVSCIGVALARPRDALHLRRVEQVAHQDPRFLAPAAWVQEAATGHIATVDDSSRSSTTK
jgi:hypothetical protein